MLRLEELETVESEATSASADAGVAAPVREKRRPKRLPLPDHLLRHEVVHAAPHADGCCACGEAMSALGEDVTEALEYVPGRFTGPSTSACAPVAERWRSTAQPAEAGRSCAVKGDALVDALQAPTYLEPMTERKKRTALPYKPGTPVPTPEAVVARLYRDFPQDMARLAAAERAEAELEQSRSKPH